MVKWEPAFGYGEPVHKDSCEREVWQWEGDDGKINLSVDIKGRCFAVSLPNNIRLCRQVEAAADVTVWAVCDDEEYVGVWVDELFATEEDANAYVQRKEAEAKQKMLEYSPDREDYGGPYTSLTVYPRTLRATLPDSEDAL